MLRLFLYRLRCTLQGRTLLFWTLLFPLLLSTLFHFAFAKLQSDTPFEAVPVAVVENEFYAKDKVLQKTLEEVGGEGEGRLLKVTLTTGESAKELLRDDKVKGIFIPGAEIGLMVKESGISQTILKSFLDEYQRTRSTLIRILTDHPEQAASLLSNLSDSKNYTKEVSLTRVSLDTTLNYFFTILAMTCLYGGFWGIDSTEDMMPNLSALGARRSVAPVPKLRSIIADLAASMVVQLSVLLVVLFYLAVVLGVNFGAQWGYILLTCVTASVFGVVLGTCLGCTLKCSANKKVGILLAFSMTGCFFAGMMVNNMRDIVAHYAPFVNYINPAALVTDCFYTLYSFDTHGRFFLNIGILWAMSLALGAVSIFKLRRQKYASI